MNESCHRHDISDALWGIIEPYTIGQKGTWGGNAKDTRLFINAIFWILRTGTPWRDLPSTYGDWKNVYRRFTRWRDKGVWERIFEAIIAEHECEWLLIDASFVKAHEHAHRAVGGSQDIGRSKGEPHQRYILPWTRMVVRSESLSCLVSRMTAHKLMHFKMA